MHQNRFSAGSARTRLGSLQRSPAPLAAFDGPTSKRGEGKEWQGDATHPLPPKKIPSYVTETDRHITLRELRPQ